MSSLATRLEDAQRAERTAALRYLLRHPLVCEREHPEMFVTIVRHRHWLASWFAEQPSWKLVVEPAAGFARLHKVPARPDGSRPAQLAGRPPFDRRRYVLLCLTLAALEECGTQTTLARLAENVASLSADDPDLERLDTNVYGDRRAFVDVLRWLAASHVLCLRDGDTEGYARSGEGDALYDVDDRLLGQILAAPRPPTMTAHPDELLHEHYPETEDGARRRSRHTVFRHLLDEPVVYYEDLPPDVYEWLDHSRGVVYGRLEEDVAFQVERRKEGLAAVDPAGEVSDMLFPDGGSTIKHAALLLAEQLAEAARAGADVVSDAEVQRCTAALMADYGQRCRWRQDYMAAGEEGAALLAGDAMGLLAAFHLVARMPGGWRPRPAIARFAPAAPGEPARGR
jgi:uncharacterized protein (TIGR02678 family)